MAPYFVLTGFTPQQIVANASIASLGLGGSSLLAMRDKGFLDTRFLWPLIGFQAICRCMNSWQECVVFSQTLDFNLLKMELEIEEIRKLLDEPEGSY